MDSKIKEALKLIDQHEFNNKGIEEWEQLKLLKLRFKVMGIVQMYDGVDELNNTQQDTLDTMNEVIDMLFFQYQKTQNLQMAMSDLRITNNNYKDLVNKIGSENVEMETILNKI